MLLNMTRPTVVDSHSGRRFSSFVSRGGTNQNQIGLW